MLAGIQDDADEFPRSCKVVAEPCKMGGVPPPYGGTAFHLHSEEAVIVRLHDKVYFSLS